MAKAAPYRWLAMGLFAVSMTAVYLLSATAVSAAPGDIVVNSSADVVADDGECTLREAVAAATDNAASGLSPGECTAGNFGPPDTIIFENVNDPIVLTQGKIALGNIGSLTIDGAGIVVDGNASGSIFQIDVGPVFLNGLTIRNGGDATGVRVSGVSNVTLSDVVVEDHDRGGIFSDTLTQLTLIRSTVRNNTSGVNGGGIETFGTVTIIDSTISNNTANERGGGLYLDNRLGTVDLTVINSTISGNQATLVAGGGISVYDGSTVAVSSSTITDNTAPAGAGIASAGTAATDTMVTSSVVADNNGGDDVDLVGGATQSFATGDNNIVGTGTGAAAFNSVNDLTNQNADLGPLQFNGGATDTHLPDAGSVVVDHVATGAGGPSFDQRGLARPQGAADDAGAIERRTGACAGVEYEASDESGLDQAIDCFNTSTIDGTHTITIENDITYTASMRTIDNPNTDADLEILADGNELDADGNGSVLSIDAGFLHVQSAVLTGGDNADGGGLRAIPDPTTAPVFVSVDETTIAQNSAIRGGAVSAHGGAGISITNSTLSNNTASAQGGGVHAFVQSHVDIVNSTISGNMSFGTGGGVQNDSLVGVSLWHTTITDNTSESGGAIESTHGEVNVGASILAGNSSFLEVSVNVPGVFVSDGYNVHGETNVLMDPTDEFVNDPDLRPLQDNGGPTETHLPDSGLPAVAIDLVPLTNTAPFDQRGLPRPQGTLGDAGAVEARPGICAGFDSTVFGFDGFDDAIQCFNTAILPGEYMIDLDDDIDYDSELSTIDNGDEGFSLVIAGNGFTLDAMATGRVLQIAAGSVTVDAAELTGGDSSAGAEALSGGGIDVGDDDATVTELRIVSSTIVGNTSPPGRGGGIHFADEDGVLEIVNSTISGNTGGGVMLSGGSGAVIASTISDNARFGLQADSDTTMYVEASIIADNQSEFFDDLAVPVGITDPFQSGGFNVLGSVDPTITAFGATDLTAVDPRLAGLADNGGLTPTHHPSPNSPAVDHVTGTVANPQSSDQRGVARPLGAAADSGAVEAEPPNPLTVLPVPCPIYDSSSASGALGGAFAGGETRTLQVTGALPANQGAGAGECIPAGATAVVFTISALDPQGVGNLRLSEANVAPQGGVVNYTANGLNNANTVTVPVSALGQVDVAANASATDVRLVAIGYHSPIGTLRFNPLTPCAVADTRSFSNNPPSGAFVGPFAAGDNFPAVDVVGTVAVAQGGNAAGTDCGIPSTADAVLVNVVAIRPQGAAGFAGKGFLATGAAGTDPEEVTTPFADLQLNNSVTTMVPLNGGETIAIDVEAISGSPSAHIRVVVLGYMENTGANYTAVNPCAAFDSRDTVPADPNPPTGLFAGKRTGNDSTTTFSIAYQITGAIPAAQGGELDCGVPSTATAVLVNLVAIQPEGVGNFRAFATGSTPTGGVVNFNALTPPINNSNAVVVPLSADGQMSVLALVPSRFFLPAVHARGVVLGYFE